MANSSSVEVLNQLYLALLRIRRASQCHNNDTIPHQLPTHSVVHEVKSKAVEDKCFFFPLDHLVPHSVPCFN